VGLDKRLWVKRSVGKENVFKGGKQELVTRIDDKKEKW
jgi:hypothetical protein